MEKGAIQKVGKRYQLWRIWDQSRPLVLFILLNPSLGDAEKDDPTIRRLCSFSKKYGFGGFYIGNLYSTVTPYPKTLYEKQPQIEKENIQQLKQMIDATERIVFAWGNNENTPSWLIPLVEEAWCFGINQNGSPKHPLYLPNATQLMRYPFKENTRP